MNAKVPRRRRTLAGFAGLLVLAIGIAGCSSDEGEDAAGAAAPSDSAAEPDPPRRFSVVMSGDVLVHNGVWESAEADAAARGKTGMDFAPMFAAMKPVYEGADLAICHLEVPLAEPDGPFLNYPLFSAPPQIVDGLKKAGIDACTTASNHSLDMGFEGLKRTLDTLDAKGVPHTGTARTRKESRTPLLLDIAGVQVALLSYTYGTNGIPMPAEAPWSVSLIDPDDIKRDARRARRAGAEVVIVALHHGTEYVTEPDAAQVDVVDEITRSKHINLVYGHHAHVPQPVDVVNGTWVAYGLGNFIAQQSTDVPDTYRGTTVKFTLVEREDGRFEVERARFVPTMITPYGGSPMRVLDARAALRDPATDPALKPSLRAALRSVREDVFSLGARRHGLRMLEPRG